MKERHVNKIHLTCLSALFCALLIISTLFLRFTIPGSNVLITAQSFFVLLCGLVLPARYGLYAIVSYILLGLMGLPVFSLTAGPGVLFTPSAGFLLGFPFAALVSNKVFEKLQSSKKGRDYIAALLGLLAMYLVALPYITLLHQLFANTDKSLIAYLSSCFLPFFPLDIVKCLLAASIAPRLRKAIQK